MLVALIIASVIFAGFFHELGHWAAAKYFKYDISFVRSGWRFLWTMPTAKPLERTIIAVAGFGLEFTLSIPILYFFPLAGIPYIFVAISHFIAYPFYAGNANDFKWFTYSGGNS